MEKWFQEEYRALRFELNERIKFLHQTINLAVIFWLVSLVVSFYFIFSDINPENLKTFLLVLPLLFDLLAFNYQFNQNSLESIARYIHLEIKPRTGKISGEEVLGWEKFFAKDKASFKFESSFKILPFVLPSLIPFFFLITRANLNSWQISLSIADLIFLALVILNFRYKFRRVK